MSARKIEEQGDPRPHGAFQQPPHSLYELNDIRRGRFQTLPPCESKQSLRQRGTAHGSLDRAFNETLSFQIACRQMFLNKAEISQHSGKEIVEVMRDTAGQLAD